MKKSVFSLMMALIFLSACSPTNEPTNTPIPATPTPEQHVLADAFFSGAAFVDANGNGQVDPDDPPLPGAVLLVTDAEGINSGGRTGADGRTFVTIPGGITYPVTLVMHPPRNGQFTVTPAEIRLESGSEGTFLFMPVAAADAPLEQADMTVTIGGVDGEIRPLLGVNVGPVPAGDPGNADVTTGYQQIGVTQVRTHDFYGPLDMATMYPDHNADPADPASYDFEKSDEVFARIVAGGFEPYLRIGDSWNNGPGFPAADPRMPANYANYVQAALYVIAHYDDQALWGSQPLHTIEIWNEPDGRFWDGSEQQFFDLFDQIAKAVKAAYPDLLVGGPGLTPAGVLSPQGQQFTARLLDYLQANNTPLDFFSWHMYSNDPAVYLDAAVSYRNELDNRGFTDVSMHVSEWNTSVENMNTPEGEALRLGGRGAALLSASWMAMQKGGVSDALFYRGTDPASDMPAWFGLFYSDGRAKRSALVFSFWAQTAAHPQNLALTTDADAGLWLLAGQNSAGEIALLAANPTDTAVTYQIQMADGRIPANMHMQQVDDTEEAVQTGTAVNPVTIGGATTQLITFTP